MNNKKYVSIEIRTRDLLICDLIKLGKSYTMESMSANEKNTIL